MPVIMLQNILITIVILIACTCESELDETCVLNECNNIEYFSSERLPIVILDYNDLKNEIDLSNSIETAYGATGLGILFVKNVPELTSKRNNLLHLSRELAHLDEVIKKSLQDADSLYSIGYSHGKEMLSKNNPDLRKMSYYANPISNDVTNGNDELIRKYRSVYGRNIWPDKDLPLLQKNFMDLGQLIHSVGHLIASQLDKYVLKQRDGYNSGLLNEIISSNVSKSRLLYYFSHQEMKEFYNNEISIQESEETNNWCGWHNDHAALTGLILAMYFDENGNVIQDIANYENSNDENIEKGGLYIKTRENITYNVELTEEESSKYLAFQIGETSQILSGGSLIATPHAVMAYKNKNKNNYHNVSRASFAVFLQPHYNVSMIAPYHKGITLQQIQFDRFLPENVPLLSSRWFNASNDTFGDFTKRTFETYYNMKMK